VIRPSTPHEERFPFDGRVPRIIISRRSPRGSGQEPVKASGNIQKCSDPRTTRTFVGYVPRRRAPISEENVQERLKSIDRIDDHADIDHRTLQARREPAPSSSCGRMRHGSSQVDRVRQISEGEVRIGRRVGPCGYADVPAADQGQAAMSGRVAVATPYKPGQRVKDQPPEWQKSAG